MVCPADVASVTHLLWEHFGYRELRPLQTRVVSALQTGRDVLAVLPTGAGKSMCFQIPALQRRSPTIVVSPLISLMQDQVAAATARGIPAVAVNSSQRPEVQRESLERIVRGHVRLVYTSPERLPRLAAELARQTVRPDLLAVDEAHCIVEWGSDFRPTYRSLRKLRAQLGWPQAIALTGSATPQVRAEIVRAIGLGGRRGLTSVVASFDRRNLWFGVATVPNERERLRTLIAALRWHPALAIVYAPTRNLTEEIARVLGNAGFTAAAYHAGLTASRRREVLERFLADRLRVVVATCAFGMGIDKPNVKLVVHWNLPATPEAYYQEAGRAGRDGGFARCLLLYRPGDALVPRRQLDVTFPPEQLAERVWSGEVPPERVPANLRASVDRLCRELRPERGPVSWQAVRRRREAALARIRVMEEYAETRRCRRRALIGYFGEDLPSCTGCDVCARKQPVPSLANRVADRRLGKLRTSLCHLVSPWGGCPIEPAVLRRLAWHPPETAAALEAVEGIGPALMERYGGTLLAALRECRDL